LNSPFARLNVGDVLHDRYEIVSILGRGGMGTVYLANDLKLKGKRWAIKETVHRAEDFDAFAREAEILMRLNHPHLPNIVDYYGPDSRGYTYLVMDYIQGRTLEQEFELAGRSMPFARVLKYAIQLCSLFGYLHAQRPHPIIYRDLKPGNVMIDEQDQVRLIDFGIARDYKNGQNSDTVQIGTIGFAAPEQFQLAQTDPRSDLYTLGATMYYLLSGGRYYYAEQVPLSRFRDDLPERFVRLVDRLLRSRPEERYQSAEEVRRELEALQAVEPSGGRPQPERVTSMHVPNRLIVVGSLYPGAGSTFVGMAIARALNDLGIPHAYVENPTNAPDLYMLLFGDKHAPRNYRFLSEQIAARETAGLGGNFVPWRDGYTEWVPIRPDGLEKPWKTGDSFKLLQAIKQPIVIYDVSCRWSDAHVIEICRSADDIVAVADTSPSKMYRPDARRTAMQLSEWHRAGKPVHLVANRDVPLRQRGQWIASFFLPVVCSFPAIDYARVVDAQWRGRLVHDHDDFRERIHAALAPLISKWVNITSHRFRGQGGKRAWWSGWSKKFS